MFNPAGPDARHFELSAYCNPNPDDGRVLNPYFRCLKASLGGKNISYRGGYNFLLAGRYDIAHVHFPEQFFRHRNYFIGLLRGILLLSGLAFARLRGIPVVWTAHNLKSHEEQQRSGIDKFAWRLFEAIASGIIFMTDYGREAVCAAYPRLSGKPYAIIPHGHFRDVVGKLPSRAEARREMQFDACETIIANFGMLRPYKGVEELMEAFEGLPSGRARLTLAGRIPIELLPPAEARHLACTLSGNSKIAVRLRALTEDELSEHIAACDLVVLPYRDVLNSGSVFYALSCNRPVCAPRLGALSELQHVISSNWLYLYDPPLTPRVLDDAIDWALTAPRGDAPDLSSFGWENIAALHRLFFDRLIAEAS